MIGTGFLAALLVLTSFTSTARSTQSPSGLEDVSWSLTTLAGQRVTATADRPAPKLRLTAADRRVTGSAGCNEFSGTYEQNGASLRFGTLEVTQRACTDPVLSQREKLLLKALRDTRSWQARKNTLTLTGPAGELVRFEYKAPTPE